VVRGPTSEGPAGPRRESERAQREGTGSRDDEHEDTVSASRVRTPSPGPGSPARRAAACASPMGRIYYKGLSFTTQAVLVLALHIVSGRIYYKGLSFTTQSGCYAVLVLALHIVSPARGPDSGVSTLDRL
jgi:hypothetical protein